MIKMLKIHLYLILCVMVFYTSYLMKKNFLIEIPNSMILSVLDLHHNSFLDGHPEKQRLLYSIRQKYNFPYMDVLTEEFVKRCSSCLEIKDRFPPLTKIGEYPLPITPFQYLHMDILGKLKRDSRTGCQYILVFKDIS